MKKSSSTIMVNSESIWVAHTENVGIHFRDDALLLQLPASCLLRSLPPFPLTEAVNSNEIARCTAPPRSSQITNEMSSRYLARGIRIGRDVRAGSALVPGPLRKTLHVANQSATILLKIRKE